MKPTRRIQVLYTSSKAERPLRKRILLPRDGYRMDPDGTEEIWYQTCIDLDALDRLACRAAANLSGKATAGPVRVQIIDRRREVQP